MSRLLIDRLRDETYHSALVRQIRFLREQNGERSRPELVHKALRLDRDVVDDGEEHLIVTHVHNERVVHWPLLGKENLNAIAIKITKKKE